MTGGARSTVERLPNVVEISFVLYNTNMTRCIRRASGNRSAFLKERFG